MKKTQIISIKDAIDRLEDVKELLESVNSVIGKEPSFDVASVVNYRKIEEALFQIKNSISSLKSLPII